MAAKNTAKKNATTTTAPAGKKGKGKGKEAPAKKGKGKEAPVVVNPHGNRGTPTAAPVEGVAKKPGKGVQVATAGSAGVATRATIHGASVTSVLRQLAFAHYPAFTVGVATALVAKLGVPLRPACVAAQVGSGRGAAKNGTPPEGFRYGPPAQLPKEQLKELAKLAGL